jgi:hypothetical protein
MKSLSAILGIMSAIAVSFFLFNFLIDALPFIYQNF